MQSITCKAKIQNIGEWSIINLPSETSAQLPSRGMVFANVIIYGQSFQTAIEPDGRGSHWIGFKENRDSKTFAPELIDALTIDSLADDNSLYLELEPLQNWAEPHLPADLADALKQNPDVQSPWKQITVKARWDWIRWIRSTKNPNTRQKRIGVAFDKLRKGDRRPCCFNRNSCTVPEVSKNGQLLELRNL